MSLLEDVKALTEENQSYLPLYELEDDGTQIVSEKIVGETRWSTINEAVLRRGDEYVLVEYQAPATEFQDGQDHYATLHIVEPYEKAVIAYRKV